jgi:hypothetical protein
MVIGKRSPYIILLQEHDWCRDPRRAQFFAFRPSTRPRSVLGDIFSREMPLGQRARSREMPLGNRPRVARLDRPHRPATRRDPELLAVSGAAELLSRSAGCAWREHPVTPQAASIRSGVPGLFERWRN